MSYKAQLLHSILPDSSIYPWEREGGMRGLQDFTASAIFLSYRKGKESFQLKLNHSR